MHAWISTPRRNFSGGLIRGRRVGCPGEGAEPPSTLEKFLKFFKSMRNITILRKILRFLIFLMKCAIFQIILTLLEFF